MIDGSMPPGFDLIRHRTYVELGYCDQVSWCKSYCCQRDGHAGDHWSLRLLADKTFMIGERWD